MEQVKIHFNYDGNNYSSWPRDSGFIPAETERIDFDQIKTLNGDSSNAIFLRKIFISSSGSSALEVYAVLLDGRVIYSDRNMEVGHKNGYGVSIRKDSSGNIIADYSPSPILYDLYIITNGGIYSGLIGLFIYLFRRRK